MLLHAAEGVGYSDGRVLSVPINTNRPEEIGEDSAVVRLQGGLDAAKSHWTANGR